MWQCIAQEHTEILMSAKDDDKDNGGNDENDLNYTNHVAEDAGAASGKRQ